MSDALAKAKAAGPEKIQPLFDQALQSTLTVSEISKEFGLHCDLGAGVPSIVHNLKNTIGYTDAIRKNIYAGGDNCGRAIVLGAVCGAMYGVNSEHNDNKNGIPIAWLAQFKKRDEVEGLLDQLFG